MAGGVSEDAGARRQRTGTRRQWALSLVAAIVLIDAFGVVLAVTHHRFAVS